MFKLIAISAVAIVAANSAFALDLTNRPMSANVIDQRPIEVAQATVTAPVTDPSLPTDQLAVIFKTVCDSKAVKSKKLTDACTLGEMPKPLKSGKGFAPVS